jgi:hypothetical protein
MTYLCQDLPMPKFANTKICQYQDLAMPGIAAVFPMLARH